MNKVKAILLACSFMLGSRSFSQNNNQIPLTDLKTTNNPCFQLLDIAPSSISESISPKALGLALLQNLSGGNSLPKNFNLSVSPYWYFKPDGETVFKYLNVKTLAPNNKDTVYNVFTGLLRKLNVSLSSTFNDSTNGSLLKNTNYFAGGISTNIMTIRSGQNQQDITDNLNKISSRERAARQAFTDSIAKTIADLPVDQRNAILMALFTDPKYMAAGIESVANFLANDKVSVSASKDLQTALNLPLFQLDAAGAYSQAFAGNSTGNSRFNRIAGWLTGTLNISLSTKHADHLSLLVLGKLLGDNLLTDTTHKAYQRMSAYDLGGRLSYAINSFSLGFEFVQRTYSDDQTFNSHRAVGFLQYKVNDNIYLTGSFGQNFGNSNNLFTLLGVNFGFGNKSASLPQ